MSSEAPAGAPTGEEARRDGLAAVSVAERSLSAEGTQWISLALVTLAAIAADQVMKHIVSSQLSLGDEIAVVGPFAITHVRNSGIAFGLFPDATSAVIVLTTVAVVWMLVFFARAGARHPVLPVALGLLLGGSISNLADRVRLGHVTDFLNVRYWPAFNFADICIVVGVAMLVGTMLAGERSPRRRHGASTLRS